MFAVFGINSDGLNLAVNLLILSLVIIYLALIYWTYMDVQRRVADPMLQACATAASLFPFIGTVVYTLVRPPEFLEDVRERELEVAAAETRLAGTEVVLCSHCDTVAEKDFLRCPKCLRKLRDPCVNCSRPLDPDWRLCPYCESEIPSVVAERRSRRRRVAEDGSTEQYAVD